MGVFLFLVIAVIVIIVLVKRAKKAKQKAAAEIILKEKAELIVSALTERGYSLTYHDVDSVGGGHYIMYVWIRQGGKDMGTLRFGTGGPSSDMGYSTGATFQLEHARDSHKINSINHVIHLDKAGILFESKVPCSEPPPEWMEICAPLLRASGYTISFPQWMEECPDASKYVNVVFQ